MTSVPRGERGLMWNSPAFGLLNIGMFFAVTIVGLTLVGVYLDGRFDTRPVLTLVGLVLGLVAATYGAYTQLRDLLRRTAEAEARRKEHDEHDPEGR